MLLLVGLGNPGNEYRGTRHNIGFEAIERLAERHQISMVDKKWKALVGRGSLAGTDCMLMKPQTFMNLSGEAVGPALGFFKLTTTEIVVVHDELDLELGRMKLKKGGGHGGHNGLRSMLAHLPDDGFVRVRLGIGRPPPAWDSADYVLSRFTKAERTIADRCVDEAADAIEAIARDGILKAMGRYNQAPKAESGKEAAKRPSRDGQSKVES